MLNLTKLKEQISKILIGILFVHSYAYSIGITKPEEKNIVAGIKTTTASGSWKTAGIWSPSGVPNSEDVVVNHNLILNSDLNIGSTYSFNATVLETLSDGIKYNLNMSGNSTLTINANTTFEGDLNSSGNSKIVVKNNSTLTIYGGAMSGSANFQIDAGSSVIIKGNFQTNGSADIKVDGSITVAGTYTATGSGNVTGTGTINSTTTTYNGCTNTNTLTTPSTTICANNTATITGSIVSGASYLWQSSTTSATAGYTTASGTSNSANYTSVSLTQTTWFQRTVTATCSNTATVQVTVNTATAITTQPTNASVCLGSNASFSVVATGTSLTYAWQYNNAGVWTNLGSTSPYSGVTTATLTLTNPNVLYNAKQYRCVVGGSCSPVSVVSNIATLSMNTLPTIVAHPNNKTICSNANATFSVSATGTGLTYAWQSFTSGIWGNIIADAVYSNVTSSTLTITTPSSSYSGKQYRCVVTGLCSPIVTSNAAILTVNQAVSITTQPSNALSCSSANASFNVIASGSALTYAWQVNNAGSWVATGNSAPYSNSTTATLNLTAPSSSYNEKQYKCIVSGTCTPSITSNIVTLSTYNNGEWMGGTGEFSTSASWCGGTPSSTSDLIINTGTVSITNSSAQAKNVTVASGASLILSGTNSLTVFGNWSNSGTITSNSGTVSFSGSVAQTVSGSNTFKHLTINNTSVSGVTVTSGAGNTQIVNGSIMLTKGSIKTNNNLKLNFDNGGAISGAGTGTITDSLTVQRNISTGFHYLGASLDNVNYYQLSKSTPLTSFYTYKESNTNPNFNYGWVKRSESAKTLFAGQKDEGGPSSMIGYALKLASPASIEMTGTYTHGASYSSGPLSYTKTTGNNADGWQILSNPYPSYIDWNSVTGLTKTGIGTSIYYYNAATGQNSQYVAGVSGLPGESISGGSQYIPPMQAFWIQTSVKNAELTVNKSAIVIPASTPSFYRQGTTDLKRVKLVAKGSSCADDAVIRYSSIATEGYDADIDATKFKNSGACPSLYTRDKFTEYSVNTMPEIVLNEKINLNFEAYTAGAYSLSLKDFQNIPDGTSLILEDKQLNIVHNFSIEPEYKFTSSVGDHAARFDIYFESDKITSTLEEVSAADIDIVSYNHHINVHFHNHMNTTANISVYDMAGKPIHELHNLDISSGMVDFKLHNVHTGIYIVKAISGQVSHSEKIQLQ